MHTYRDAIPRARSVWTLYPGSAFRFFPAEPAVAPITAVTQLSPAPADGVGALPLVPADAPPVAVEQWLTWLCSGTPPAPASAA